MISYLSFKNFKSWKKLDIEFEPITGVFGTNSSGKSSIIQFLLLLKQTKDDTDRATALNLNGDHVKFGSIIDVIHRHDEAAGLDWQLSIKLDNKLHLVDPSEKRSVHVAVGEKLVFRAQAAIYNKAPNTTKISYRLGDMRFVLKSPKESPTKFELSAAHVENKQPKFSFVRTKGRPWHLPGPIKSYAFPDQARTYFQNAGFLADLEREYEKQLDAVYYLGPLREYPQRDYLWSRSRPSDVGSRGEKVIEAILAATEADETRNLSPRARRKPFQEMIAYWLREMGLIDDFKVREIAANSNRWQAQVRVRPGASWVLLTDVGFGISQVLPVITLLQYVPERSTVILEQPEIHLHPLAQAALADAIIQASTHRKIQVILESHSEHLLLRLQRRIAEESIQSEKVRLYFCDAESGDSILTKLELDLFGRITNWPPKFMGDAFKETAAAETARLLRIRKSTSK